MMNSAAGHSGSTGLAGGVGGEDGVALLDGIQGGEEGGMGIGEAVGLVPLDIADPEGGAGERGGVGIELDAEELVGLDGGLRVE